MASRNRIPRWAFQVLAVVFLGATVLFSALWIYYARWEPKAELGIRFHYSPHKSAIRVEAVDEGSTAQQSGLRAGDFVTNIQGRELKNPGPYYDAVTRGQPGDTIQLTVSRDGAKEPLSLTARLAPAGATVRKERSERSILELVDFYPLGFLVVGFAVLFLRIEDRNAWRLALMFAGLIAAVPLIHIEGEIRPELRGYALAYKALFAALGPAAFYYFFAVFPAASPVERRVPWLKWFFTVLGLVAGVPAAIWALAANGSAPLLKFAGDYGMVWRYTARGAVLDSVAGIAPGVLLGLILLAIALGLASLVLNALRAEKEARRKARVILWGTLAGSAPFVAITLASFWSRQPFYDYPTWFWLPMILLSYLMPASYAYAVVRHRVLDFPVLLRRSARYLLVQRGFVVLLVVASVAVTFVLVEVFTRYVQPRVQAAVPIGLTVGVAFGMALIWAGAKARGQVTSRIDRAFFRSAYDARQILQELAEQSRATTDRSELAGLLVVQIGQALHPKMIGVFLTGPDGLRRVDAGMNFDAPQTIPLDWALLPQLAANPAPVDLTEFLLRVLRERLHTLTANPILLDLPEAAGGKGLPLPRIEEPLRLPPALAELEPECLAPMVGREGKLVGLLALGPRMSEEPYSSEDRRLLQLVASQAAMAVENIRLAERMAERIEVDSKNKQEMEIARQVQARLFPQNLPPMRTLEYAGSCRQARAVGGDYYDFLDLGEGRLALLLADISGKGMSAALLMAHLQANLRGHTARAHENARELLCWVNQMLFESTSPEHYATLFFAIYDDAARTLRYINCGHNAPVLFRNGGQAERLGPTATVVGLIEEWDCEMEEVALELGDTLVVFSDGVTEAANEHSQLFGDVKLIDLVQRNMSLPAKELMAAIAAEVTLFSGREQEDDLTLVIARVR